MRTKFIWMSLGLVAFVVLLGCVYGMFVFIVGLMKGEAYQLSFQRLKEHEQVIQTIGQPIESSWYVMGNVSTSGPDGKAAIEYAIEGSESSAKVFVYATRKSGLWSIDELIVAPDPGDEHQRITVVEASPD